MDKHTLELVEQKLERDYADRLKMYESDQEMLKGCKTEKRKRFYETSSSMDWSVLNYLNELKRWVQIEKASAYVEEILNQPDDELLAEFEQLPGGVEGNVAKMRELIKQGVEKANQERKD